MRPGEFGKRLSLAQACERSGLTRAAMYRLIRARRIAYVQDGPSSTPGRRGANYYIYERDLQTYMDSVRRDAIAAPVAPLSTPHPLAADISDLMPKERRLQ